MIQMGLCGKTLEQEIRSKKQISVAVVRRYLNQLADAFGYLEEKQIVHRDLKTDNICFDISEASLRVVDFGLATRAGTGKDLTQSQMATVRKTRGHPFYRSPENLAVDIHGKCMNAVGCPDDMWALGLVLYQMVTGDAKSPVERPIPVYDPKDKYTKMARRDGFVEDVRQKDEHLGAIVDGLLQTNPLKRLTAREVKKQLCAVGRAVDAKFSPFADPKWIVELKQEAVPTLKAAMEQFTQSAKSHEKRGVTRVLAECLEEAEELVTKLRNADPPQYDHLTDDEMRAVYIYTDDVLHEPLNKALRSGKPIEKTKWRKFCRLLLSGLDKLPQFPQPITVYRGVKMAINKADDDYKTGIEFTWDAFSSASTDGEIGEGFAEGNTFFIIQCTRGKDVTDLSANPMENEVLLPMGMKLRVANKTRLSGLDVISLEEVQAKEGEEDDNAAN
jgi:serine/threonine protein kinase